MIPCSHIDLDETVDKSNPFSGVIEACRVRYRILPLTFLKEVYDELSQHIDSEINTGSIMPRISFIISEIINVPAYPTKYSILPLIRLKELYELLGDPKYDTALVLGRILLFLSKQCGVPTVPSTL